MKRYQRNSQSFPVTELTFESKLEYQLAVPHRKHIFNVHFKVEPKSTKMKLLQCYNCQKCRNHVFKRCKYQPMCVLCGNDHPSSSHIEYFCRISHKCFQFRSPELPKKWIYCNGDHPAFAESCRVYHEIYDRNAVKHVRTYNFWN